MDGYGPETYGSSFADVYDVWYPAPSDTDATVRRLDQLAGDGAILELGAGTGRLTIPLASSTRTVVGLDASPDMLDRLRAKNGGERVQTVVADMAEIPVAHPGGFGLVFVVVNTFFNLATDTAQQACLARVNTVLAPEGRLVIEAFVPPDPDDIPVSSVAPSTLDLDRVVLTATRHDSAGQQIFGQHIELTEAGGVQLRPWMIRYASPAQLDQMAVASGLVLESRHAGWSDEPFTPDSGHHVSVYRKVH